MRTLFFAGFLAILVLATAITSLISLGSIAINFYQGQPLMDSFQVFALSTLLFLVAVVSYIVTKTLTNTELIAKVLAEQLERELERDEMQQRRMGGPNILSSLLGGMMGGPGQTSVSITAFDKNGNAINMGDKTFDNPEDLIKYRNEVLEKYFGKKPAGKKEMKDMTLEELKAEEKKAVDNQDFELAASIKSLIDEKKNGNN